MKNFSFFKNTIFLLILVVTNAGCNRQPNIEGNENSEEKFCSYLKVGNMDKTISIINDFLSKLSDELDDYQRLQELDAWLLSFPCIIDTRLIDNMTTPHFPIREITISFEESGVKKYFNIVVFSTQPLKVVDYYEFENTSRIVYIHLREITEESLIYDVYTISPGIMGDHTVEYKETENNTMKVDIFQIPFPLSCYCMSNTTISIKKDIYQKAIITAYSNNLLIGTKEISLPNSKK